MFRNRKLLLTTTLLVNVLLMTSLSTQAQTMGGMEGMGGMTGMEGMSGMGGMTGMTGMGGMVGPTKVDSEEKAKEEKAK